MTTLDDSKKLKFRIKLADGARSGAGNEELAQKLASHAKRMERLAYPLGPSMKLLQLADPLGIARKFDELRDPFGVGAGIGNIADVSGVGAQMAKAVSGVGAQMAKAQGLTGLGPADLRGHLISDAMFPESLLLDALPRHRFGDEIRRDARDSPLLGSRRSPRKRKSSKVSTETPEQKPPVSATPAPAEFAVTAAPSASVSVVMTPTSAPGKNAERIPHWARTLMYVYPAIAALCLWLGPQSPVTWVLAAVLAATMGCILLLVLLVVVQTTWNLSNGSDSPAAAFKKAITDLLPGRR